MFATLCAPLPKHLVVGVKPGILVVDDEPSIRRSSPSTSLPMARKHKRSTGNKAPGLIWS